MFLTVRLIHELRVRNTVATVDDPESYIVPTGHSGVDPDTPTGLSWFHTRGVGPPTFVGSAVAPPGHF